MSIVALAAIESLILTAWTLSFFYDAGVAWPLKPNPHRDLWQSISMSKNAVDFARHDTTSTQPISIQTSGYCWLERGAGQNVFPHLPRSAVWLTIDRRVELTRTASAATHTTHHTIVHIPFIYLFAAVGVPLAILMIRRYRAGQTRPGFDVWPGHTA